MKEKIFKHISIIIILLFCLAPLNAIDLNQDNHTKLINQNGVGRNISVENLSSAANDDNNLIGTINSTENQTNVVVANTTCLNETNKTNRKFTYPYFRIHVDDIMEGETALIEVTTESSISTYAYVECNHQNFTLRVDHGHGSASIDGLPQGTYVAKLRVQNANNTNQTIFTVKGNNNKTNPNLSIKINDIYPTQKAVAEINAHYLVDGNAELRIDGSSTVYQVYIFKGKASVTLDTEDLASGEYSATITYKGNDLYNPVKTSTRFVVKPKKDPIINVKVENKLLGRKPIVRVYTEEDYSGLAFIRLDGKLSKIIEIKNGIGEVCLDIPLTLGDHTVEVNTQPISIFKESNRTINFHIRSEGVDMKVDDIYEGDPVRLEIISDYYNEVTVITSLDYETFELDHYKDGYYNCTISGENLTVGPHVLCVMIYDSDNFSWKWVIEDVEFNVKKRPSD